MTIAYRGLSKGPFGGPAGATRNAVDSLVNTLLERKDKNRVNEQNKMLADLFQKHASSEDPMSFVKAVMSSRLDDDTKARAFQMATGQAGIAADAAKTKLYGAQTKALQTPEPEKTVEVEIWKPDGTPAGKRRVPESEYNQFVEQLESQGYMVQKPDKKEGEKKSDFERILGKLEKSKTITPEQKSQYLHQWVKKRIAEGSEDDPANIIVLGDGMKVTLGELRAQYREKYNIPDEFELMLMSQSPDPAMREQAMRLKAQAAGKPSFVEFLQDVKKNGIEGLRPAKAGTKSSGPKLPPLPEGFVLE